MKSKVRTSHLLFALLVAAFITFYPQLDAGGYCGDGGCPEVSYPAHAAGAASGAAPLASGASFVVAALVAVPGVLLVRAAGSVLPMPPPGVLFGITLSLKTPPPRPPA